MGSERRRLLGEKLSRDLYLEQECRKCGNNRGTRAPAFKAPEVTKGSLAQRAQVEVGGGEARQAVRRAFGGSRVKERRKRALATGLPFEGRLGGGYTTQAPLRERNGGRKGGGRERRREGRRHAEWHRCR